jgi:DNA-binding protein YbaB
MSRTDDVADLRDDIDRVSQRFEKAAAATAGPSTASDESGAATVTITEEGHLKDVRIQTDWTSRVAPEALGGAVLAAWSAAGIARLEAWGASLAEDMDAAPPQLRPLPPMSESLSARFAEVVGRGGSPDETRALLEQMAELLREVKASIGEARDDLATLQRAEVTGRSPNGYVEVVLSAIAELKDVRYSEAWLTRAHPTNIGRETTLAYQDALRAVAHRGVEAAVASTRLGQLQALVNDPEAFARRLRG